jgi:hypothetical protein
MAINDIIKEDLYSICYILELVEWYNNMTQPRARGNLYLKPALSEEIQGRILVRKFVHRINSVKVTPDKDIQAV